MADHGATSVARQPAGDLFGGMSHRKAFPHDLPQVRLAYQLETAVPAPPPCRQVMRPRRGIATIPGLRPLAIAPPLATDRRMIPPDYRSDPAIRHPGGMQPRNLDPLV